MADPDSPPDTPQSPPAKPFILRLAGVFIEPGVTFEDIARKPDFIAPLILLILVSLAVVETMLAKIGIRRIVTQVLTQSGQAARMDPAQLNQAVEKGASIWSVIVQVEAFLGPPIFLLIVAGFGLLILNVFFGERAKFKGVFSTTCYAFMPRVLAAVMAIAVIFFEDPDAFNPGTPAPTNPGYFMNPLTTSHAVFTLASSLDIFTFWSMALLAIGLARVSRNKIKTGSIFMTLAGAWVLLVVVRVAIVAIV